MQEIPFQRPKIQKHFRGSMPPVPPKIVSLLWPSPHQNPGYATDRQYTYFDTYLPLTVGQHTAFIVQRINQLGNYSTSFAVTQPVMQQLNQSCKSKTY